MEKIEHLLKYHNISLFGCQLFFSNFGFRFHRFDGTLKHIYDWQIVIGWLYINKWKSNELVASPESKGGGNK